MMTKINDAVFPHLVVRRGINGLGLFTDIAIKEGDFIIEYWGEVIDEAEANKRGGKYLFQTGKDRHVDGTTRENIARYINHSCKPNCEVKVKKGCIYIYAYRNIKAGEELCYDYGEEYWDEYIKPKGCRCEKCEKKRTKDAEKEQGKK